MITEDIRKVLVLRLRKAADKSDFHFRVAELPTPKAREWERWMAAGSADSSVPEINGAFSDPLTLPEVMDKLQARDFQVVDYPAR